MMYNHIRIILATKHSKEQAIQQPFEDAFNANVFVPNDYDTDQFGSFTGEIARTLSPLDTAIAKAKKAAIQYGYDYAIASEGSFGPHPSIFFTPADSELLCFIDIPQNIIITETVLTTDTNYAHQEISRADDYARFLEKMQFGSHAVMVRGLTDNAILAKGVTEYEALNAIVAEGFNRYTRLRLETDMRAMVNPTRMNVIRKLTYQLIDRINQVCEQCQAPGFGKKSVAGNLSCQDCSALTELYQYQVLNCVKCSYQKHCPRPDGLVQADPKYCPNCNP